MNKKIILYFLIALIVIIATTDSSYAALITGRLDVNKTLAFWTPERIKNARPLILKNIGFKNKTTSATKSNNAKITADDDPETVPPFDNPNNPLNYPVGMLFFSDPDTGDAQYCTASVFNTDNGNIGATAAHCLFNDNGAQFNNIAFSPGYDLGNYGPLGLIPAELVAAPAEFHDDPDTPFDYGMMRFDFNDPSGATLQQHTGANGWVLGLDGDNIETTVFGYPREGDMPDCPKDGLHICVMVSDAVTRDNQYEMPGVNLGDGVSGAAWTINHDPNRNLGYMYSNHAFYNFQGGFSEAPRYVPQDFKDLLEYVTDN